MSNHIAWASTSWLAPTPPCQDTTRAAQNRKCRRLWRHPLGCPSSALPSQLDGDTSLCVSRTAPGNADRFSGCCFLAPFAGRGAGEVFTDCQDREGHPQRVLIDSDDDIDRFLSCAISEPHHGAGDDKSSQGIGDQEGGEAHLAKAGEQGDQELGDARRERQQDHQDQDPA
jgi:hypothetical protein